VTDMSQAPADGASGGAPAGNSTPPSPPDQISQLKSQGIPLAVEIGWTMGVLAGTARAPSASDQQANTDPLPTEHELSPADRRALEAQRVKTLLDRLGGLLPSGPDQQQQVPQVQLPSGAQAAAPDAPGDQAIVTQANLNILESLTQANLAILNWLVPAGREYSVAYQLGRSLRDTADLPPPGGTAGDALVKQLSRARVSAIQGWLSTVQPYLPVDSAAIVSVSIGRWSDLIAAIFDKSSPGRLRRFIVNKNHPRGLRRFKRQSESDVAGELTNSLLPQGDAWINLLVGTQSPQRVLAPEGYVAAGEATLGRSARIVRKVAAHYWFLLVILAAALGGVLYFAASGIGGAGRAWTQIAAVAGTLGVTWKGIATAVTRLSAEAEKSIFGLEKIDATAWAVTTIPADLKLNSAGVRALRRAGIPPSGPMGGS
jgi:hypothetical protein